MNFTGALVKAVEAIKAPAPTGTSERILDAALRQFELTGIGRTTVEDITRRARLARVTLYRHFPSKNDIVEAVIQRELGRFLAEVIAEMFPHEGIEDKVVGGFVYVVTALRENRLLNTLRETEPEELLPYLTTDGQSFIDTASEFLATQLAAESAERRSPEDLLVVSEIAVRLIVSFYLTPSSNIAVGSPDDARRFARQHLLPLLRTSQQSKDQT